MRTQAHVIREPSLAAKRKLWVRLIAPHVFVAKNGCWEVTRKNGAIRISRAYTHIRPKGIPMAVHRIALELKTGKSLGLLWALHRCDNPKCCNPKHLFPGTPKDNWRDAFQKKRTKLGTSHKSMRVFGERQGLAALTDNGVKQVRRQYAAGGITMIRLARKFRVSEASIFRAIRRQTWKHIN